MKIASFVLGLIGGLMTLGLGGYGYILGSFFSSTGGPGGSLQFISLALPVIALVGAGIVLTKPIVGGSIMAVSVIGILILFGFNFLNSVMVVLLGIASFLAFADWKWSSPTHTKP